jgi:Leucine-rich repeat (LRR) protein
MASPRDLPPWLRTILNGIAILGVGATLMGMIQKAIGIVILTTVPLYIAWEIWPWVVRNTRRSPFLSLIVFVLSGGFLGVGAWWAIRTFTKPPDNQPANQQSHISPPISSSSVDAPKPISPKRVGGGPAPPVDPVGNLSALGWTVKRDGKLVQFEIANSPLPNMVKSATYFKEILEPFRLHFQNVPNLSGLNHLYSTKQCQEIAVNASDLTDIKELGGFVHLKRLEIAQVPITTRSDIDSAPLAALVNLTSLVLNSSRVSDVTPVSRMPQLDRLIIESTLIRNLSPLGSLRKLKILDVRGSKVTDFSAITGNSELEELVVDTRQVSGLGVLSSLPSLQKLTVIGQQPVDLSPIGNLAHLQSLFIWGVPFMNVGFLAKLTNLNNLQISGIGFGRRSQVTDADAMCSSASLKTLTLGALEIQSLSFVAQCRELTEINLSDVPVSSLNDWAFSPALKKISLVDVPVVEISPLLALPNLENLSLIRVPARADVISALERKGVKVTNP